MTLLIFFSLVLVTLVLAILINRIVKCPLLVALAIFSVILLVAAILSNTTLIIGAVILGILAFLAAFLDCVFSNSGFFRNNNCLSCKNPYNNCNCNNNNDTLTIINSNGETVARINGDSVSCYNNNNGCCSNSPFLSELADSNNFNTVSNNNTNSSCGYCRKFCGR